MVHSADTGRGIIGVMDVTDIMVISSLVSLETVILCFIVLCQWPSTYRLTIHHCDSEKFLRGFDIPLWWQDFGDGKVGVLNNKQGFTDSDRYHKLEKWLGATFGTYWDEKFDQFKLFTKDEVKEGETVVFEDEGHWVQCLKCEKWRELPKGMTSDQFDDIQW